MEEKKNTERWKILLDTRISISNCNFALSLWFRNLAMIGFVPFFLYKRWEISILSCAIWTPTAAATLQTTLSLEMPMSSGMPWISTEFLREYCSSSSRLSWSSWMSLLCCLAAFFSLSSSSSREATYWFCLMKSFLSFSTSPLFFAIMCRRSATSPGELVIFFHQLRYSALHDTNRTLNTFKDIVYIFKIGLSRWHFWFLLDAFNRLLVEKRVRHVRFNSPRADL